MVPKTCTEVYKIDLTTQRPLESEIFAELLPQIDRHPDSANSLQLCFKSQLVCLSMKLSDHMTGAALVLTSTLATARQWLMAANLGK